MQFLTHEESARWLDGLACQRQAIAAAGRTFKIPKDSGQKTALARLLTNAAPMPAGLLYFDEYGIWPSAQSSELFNGYRRSLGESGEVWQTPGHLFGGGELEQIEALLCLGLYFVWGLLLVSADGGTRIAVSHDELMAVAESDPARPLQNALLNF